MLTSLFHNLLCPALVCKLKAITIIIAIKYLYSPKHGTGIIIHGAKVLCHHKGITEHTTII